MRQENRYILRDMERFESITNVLRAQNLQSEYQVLDLKIIESNRFISQKLKIPIASRIFYFRKLRLIDSIPKSIEKTYILYDKVKGVEEEDLSRQSFYQILQDRFGYTTCRSEEEILVVEAGQEEQKLLRRGDEELMMIKGITYREYPEPFEYFEIVSVPDLYEFRSITKL